MNDEEKPKRAAKKKQEKKVGRKPTHSLGRAVAFDDEGFHILAAAATKFGHSKSAFASAAVRYFAERGLDPTVEHATGLADLEHKLDALAQKVDGETLRIRQQNVDIANRLIGLLRGWQKDSYEFHHNVQKGLINYLQVIESDVLRHLLEQENNLFAPLIENVFRVNAEATNTREITQVLLAKSENKLGELKANVAQLASERDEESQQMLSQYLEKHPMPRPRVSTKPAPVPVPERKPIVPAGSVPPAPALDPASAPPEAPKP